jgi:AcrR family transcriptional regulator
VNAALEEFSGNDFESASLSDIIGRLGIAKGSFYRYFESKEALFDYLRQLCGELFTHGTMRVLHGGNGDFAALWRDMLLGFKKKEEEYPMIIRFWLKVNRDRPPSPEGRNEILRQKVDMLGGGYVSMIILYHLMALIEYIGLKYQIPPDKPVFSLSEAELEAEVGMFADVLLNGIKSKMPGGS